MTSTFHSFLFLHTYRYLHFKSDPIHCSQSAECKRVPKKAKIGLPLAKMFFFLAKMLSNEPLRDFQISREPPLEVSIDTVDLVLT